MGDVLLSRGVAEAIEAHDDPEWPFRPMAARYAEVDFTFANLEFPFAKKTLVPVRGNIFNAPQSWIDGLVRHKFRVLNLANNHAMDQGLPGLLDTVELVRAHGLVGFGAGRREKDAWEPGIIEVEGIRIGFVGACYSSINDDGSTWLPHVARIEDKHRLIAAIEGLKERTDFIVATMHAGIEYVPVEFGPQQLFAKAAVKAGADIVIGAHPHVVQPAVLMDGVWVFYSLGNFIFDMEGRHTDEGAALDITLSRDGDGAVSIERLSIVPVHIEEGAAAPAEGELAAGVLARMKVPGAVLIPAREADGSP